MENIDLLGCGTRSLFHLRDSGHPCCYQSRSPVEMENMDTVPDDSSFADPWIRCTEIRGSWNGCPKVCCIHYLRQGPN